MPESSLSNDIGQKLSLKDVVVLITLLLNISALVWGAAKLATTVESLTLTVSKLSVNVDALTTKISDMRVDYGARILVLEEKMKNAPIQSR
jgi:hypothetical protein